MARNGGRIVIVSDFGPNRLLRLAEEVAKKSQFIVEDLIDDARDGFHVCEGPPELGYPLLWSAITPVPLNIEVFVDRTRKGDGRVTIDWWVLGNCQWQAKTFANRLENLIEDDGGEVLESYDD